MTRRLLYTLILAILLSLLSASAVFAQTPAGPPVNASPLELWDWLIGVCLPPLIAIVMQPTWTKAARSVVSLLIFLVVGTGTAYFQGQIDGTNWPLTIVYVGVGAAVAHLTFWKQTGITDHIEQATSPGTG